MRLPGALIVVTATVAGLALIGAGLGGVRAAVIGYRAGLLLVGIGWLAELAAVVLGAAILARGGGLGWAALALVGAVVTSAFFGYWAWRGATAPPIHDVTTAPEEPPPFAAVIPLRGPGSNPVEYSTAVADRQREAYPELEPFRFEAAPSRVFEEALAAGEAMGWRLVEADRDEHRFEATASTFWFGFEDDIVVRVRPEDAGSRVDVRSASRVGVSDLGTNARRIEAFRDRLAQRLEGG